MLEFVCCIKNKWYFCTAFESKCLRIAEIAQLVEHNLAKVGVASSSLVFRSHILRRAPLSPGGGMVDAPVSGTGVSNDVQVRVLFWAPTIEAFQRTMLTMERWRNW